MTNQKVAKGFLNISISEMDYVDMALCGMLRENVDCCIVQDSSGSVVGYLNKKDIAEVVKPLKA